MRAWQSIRKASMSKLRKCKCRECRYLSDKCKWKGDMKRRTNERMRTMERSARRDFDPDFLPRERLTSPWDFL